MTDLVVHPAEAPLVGSVPVPSDPRIAHRALLLAALCNGKSRIRAWPRSEANERTRAALEAMGVVVDDEGKDAIVTGAGLFGLREPARPLDCGASAEAVRLLSGVLVAQPFSSVLSPRPPDMARLLAPLRARGARIEERDASLAVAGLPEGEHLGAVACELPVASEHEKSALLFSGLYAHGETILREPIVSPDHTERLLLSLGVPLRTVASMIELDPSGWNGSMPAFDVRPVGDFSAAAFVVCAALVVPGSRVSVRGVGTNASRAGLLDVLRDMQAPLAVEPHGGEHDEPIADLHVQNPASSGASPLVAIATGAERVLRSRGEIPALCAVAARANGTTTLRDTGDVADLIDLVRSFGVACEPLPDGIAITGKIAPLAAAEVDVRGDGRLAMTAALLALVARGPSRIRGVDAIGARFPRFVGTLRALGATIDIVN